MNTKNGWLKTGRESRVRTLFQPSLPLSSPLGTRNTSLHVPCVSGMCVCKIFLGDVCNVQVITYILQAALRLVPWFAEWKIQENQKPRKNEKQTGESETRSTHSRSLNGGARRVLSSRYLLGCPGKINIRKVKVLSRKKVTTQNAKALPFSSKIDIFHKLIWRNL